jgi:hypothetical protein
VISLTDVINLGIQEVDIGLRGSGHLNAFAGSTAVVLVIALATAGTETLPRVAIFPGSVLTSLLQHPLRSLLSHTLCARRHRFLHRRHALIRNLRHRGLPLPLLPRSFRLHLPSI